MKKNFEAWYELFDELSTNESWICLISITICIVGLLTSIKHTNSMMMDLNSYWAAHPIRLML